MGLEFNLSAYPYPSRRRVIFARHGMVCTGQPLAAQAGLRMLQAGGNAVDAAIATAICLTVVEPTSNGLGSDAFAIVWMKDKMYGLNGSGHAPASFEPGKIGQAGHYGKNAHPGLDSGYGAGSTVRLVRTAQALWPSAFCQIV